MGRANAVSYLRICSSPARDQKTNEVIRSLKVRTRRPFVAVFGSSIPPPPTIETAQSNAGVLGRTALAREGKPQRGPRALACESTWMAEPAEVSTRSAENYWRREPIPFSSLVSAAQPTARISGPTSGIECFGAERQKLSGGIARKSSVSEAQLARGGKILMSMGGVENS
jgi:hypothetical protein